MRYVEVIDPSGSVAFKMSVLGLGCAPFMGRVGRGDSLKALSAASDAGINFFDTARSYGYGESEGLLGEFLKGRRQSAIICTKFGIVPAQGGWKQRIKPLAQSAIRLFPKLRKFARRQAAGQSTGGQFSVHALQRSFETSLRQLQTDYVDMLLLHAATLPVLDQDDVLEAMGRLVESGKVRMAGISGDHPVIVETIRRKPKILTTVQFALNISCLDFTGQTRRPEARSLLMVANHPFGGPAGVPILRAIIDRLPKSTVFPEELRRKLEEPDPQAVPEILLNVILQGTQVSAVLPSMARATSLAANLRAVDHCRFTVIELGMIREELIRLARAQS